MTPFNIKTLKHVMLLSIVAVYCGHPAVAAEQCALTFTDFGLVRRESGLSSSSLLEHDLIKAMATKDYVEIHINDGSSRSAPLTGKVEKVRKQGSYFLVDFINIEDQRGSFEIRLTEKSSVTVLDKWGMSPNTNALAASKPDFKTILNAMKNEEYVAFGTTFPSVYDGVDIGKPRFIKNGRVDLQIGFDTITPRSSSLVDLYKIHSLKILTVESMVQEILTQMKTMSKFSKDMYSHVILSLTEKKKIRVKSGGVMGYYEGIVEVAYVDRGRIMFIMKIEDALSGVRYERLDSIYSLDISLAP